MLGFRCLLGPLILHTHYMGGWGDESTREVVSCRGCVRARSGCPAKSGPEMGYGLFRFTFSPAGLSLFPFQIAGLTVFFSKR